MTVLDRNPASAPAAPAVTRLGPGELLCVVHDAAGLDAADVTAMVERLAGVYRQTRPDVQWRAVQPAASVVVLVACSAGVDPALPTVHGLPVGAAGIATDQELRAVLADPARARDLLGAWTLVGTVPHVRLVTSPDLTHTLKTATNGSRRAWSTRGLAALVACGVRPTINPEVVPEFVTLDYVLGDDELLAGVRTVAEATVIDITDQRHHEASYWVPEERFSPGPATDAADLHRELLHELRRLVGVQQLWLALTAGRDSRLVAACLHELEADVCTFTMGAGTPDAEGAEAVARHFGWPHLAVAGEAWQPEWRRGVAASAWTEGLVVVRDLLGAPPSWPFPSGAVTVWGSGGETGRAFYWAHLPPSEPPTTMFVRPPALLAADAADQWSRRAKAAVDSALQLVDGDPCRALDVVYARGRMRKWLARGRPIPGVIGTFSAYTSPRMTRVLLGLPTESRRTGHDFDLALAARSLPQTPRQVPPSRAQRMQQRVQRAIRSRRPHSALTRVLQQRGAPPHRVIGWLGQRWWDQLLLEARRNPAAAQPLWNALTVEALADWLDEA